MKTWTMILTGVVACSAALAWPTTAHATESVEVGMEDVPSTGHKPADEPTRVGGHLGVATPYLAVSKDTSVIGKDRFLTILNPIGLTVHTSKDWALDFEFVVATSVLKKSPTSLIVDPGIIYKALPVALGLRAAYQVGEAGNFGLIPLVNKGFKVAGVTWFIEAAFPTFAGKNGVVCNAVAHTGVAF